MSSKTENVPAARWMKTVLFLAAIYNGIWGTWAALAPQTSMQFSGMSEQATYPHLWQGLGMLLFMFGILYLFAATDPHRYWPVALVGLIAKCLGVIGILVNVFNGTLPSWTLWMTIPNDLVWIIPFVVIVWHGIRHDQNRRANATAGMPFESALNSIMSQHDRTLAWLNDNQSVMILFLRHSGCTFCREALADLAEQRTEIEKQGHKLAIVHMGDEGSSRAMFASYGLDDVHRFSDPDQVLYRAFELDLGSPKQLFSPKVLWRGFLTAIIHRHGFSTINGNGFRMPGLFVIKDNQIITAYRHQDASDRPNYCQIATTPNPS